MSDLERKFHETWLGMVQPVEGLVVSIPVLEDAQVMERQPPEKQALFQSLAPDIGGRRAIADLERFLADLLELGPELFDRGEALPADLSLYVPEGGQTLRPSLALRRAEDEAPVEASTLPDDSTPASRAGARYQLLVWDLPPGLPLDKPETQTGPWEYPPSVKFDRLLRACRVPVGLLTNREVVRLVYAPHGESSGAITFRVEDMAQVGGRPILDAFGMLLSRHRLFVAHPEHRLPRILRESRTRQANVTNELADQVFAAIGVLLRGFEAAAERDKSDQLARAMEREPDHLYGGLLTVLLRLVFLLYAEDRGLLPVEEPLYAVNFSVLELFARLQADRGAYPDTMSRRFGAWPRLLALFRAIFLGVEYGELDMPARRGELFDPGRYPFLEGWGPDGGAPVADPEARAAVRVPTVDDETVYQVLEKLLLFEGQRLSYRALDVEQIGSVYEELMGYHVQRMPSAAICVRSKKAKIWVAAQDVLDQKPAARAGWLVDELDLEKEAVKKAKADLEAAHKPEEVLSVLEPLRIKKVEPVLAGRLVLQPGAERRRTSSHYTPRSLSAPIVQRTLEPLLAAMGPNPSSARLLELKVCDPAMGSGAFLVEACRFLADQVVAAWTREGRLDKVASANDDVVNEARRLVAQRCLYGVDKNSFAVNLAKLSMWLVTLAKDEPFTFIDHALRHGDSLVGLSLDQIRGFHWAPEQQLELCHQELSRALEEALGFRQQILALASSHDRTATQEKERLLRYANDELDKARLIADLIVGAWFACDSDKDRKAERNRRLDLVLAWLRSGGPAPEGLREMQRQLRKMVPTFHWMLEYPEVFYDKRPDPLDDNQTNHAAWIDAFVGNPPFLGISLISGSLGSSYKDWIFSAHEGIHGKCDLAAHFFRRADVLLGLKGTIGFIATNTLTEGDTRESGIKWLVDHGASIYDATENKDWPGEAGVNVHVIHITKSLLVLQRLLNGKGVLAINSRLEPRAERKTLTPLLANSSLSFNGVKISGEGFTLDKAKKDHLVSLDPRNAQLIWPYMGGKEITEDPHQKHKRYAINFGNRSLQDAEKFPELLQIVREQVKPERDKTNRDSHRKNWWIYGDRRPGLYSAISGLKRCLVAVIHSEHLCFSFQETDKVFSHGLNVFAIDDYARFSVLQSRLHERWAWLLSSSLEDRLRYSPSDCFETFPFPLASHLGPEGKLEAIGKALYAARTKLMVDRNQGLTDTYNQLKNPECRDPAIEVLRELHLEMDREVWAAYGWPNFKIPMYTTPTTEQERKELEAFADEVLDRLFELNAKRAEEERVLGLAAAKGGAKGKGKAKPKGKKGVGEEAQLGLLPGAKKSD